MNVLFIEDDRMNRRVVRDMLDVAGATMAEAESAEIGLDMIDRETYHMILIDLRMPGMDGITAIRHIRARADAKAELPIIVITADSGVDLRERCLGAGPTTSSSSRWRWTSSSRRWAVSRRATAADR